MAVCQPGYLAAVQKCTLGAAEAVLRLIRGTLCLQGGWCSELTGALHRAGSFLQQPKQTTNENKVDVQWRAGAHTPAPTPVTTWCCWSDTRQKRPALTWQRSHVQAPKGPPSEPLRLTTPAVRQCTKRSPAAVSAWCSAFETTNTRAGTLASLQRARRKPDRPPWSKLMLRGITMRT